MGFLWKIVKTKFGFGGLYLAQKMRCFVFRQREKETQKNIDTCFYNIIVSNVEVTADNLLGKASTLPAIKTASFTRPQF